MCSFQIRHQVKFQQFTKSWHMLCFLSDVLSLVLMKLAELIKRNIKIYSKNNIQNYEEFFLPCIFCIGLKDYHIIREIKSCIWKKTKYIFLKSYFWLIFYFPLNLINRLFYCLHVILRSQRDLLCHLSYMVR